VGLKKPHINYLKKKLVKKNFGEKVFLRQKKNIYRNFGAWGLLIFLFVDLHKCGSFNFVNFQAPLLCGLGPKLQGPMILTPLYTNSLIIH